ncbi:MAG: hypothetical protein ACYDHH_25360 [Solirubrobacteraceae bacterium]
MGFLKNRLVLLVVSVVGVVALLPVTTASAGNPPDPIKLSPVDGAHWQGQAGLPDTRGNANQALVSPSIDSSTPLGELPVGTIRGVDGLPTSVLGSVGFAVPDGLPSGIEPCWLVGFTDPSGNPSSFMLMTGGSVDSRGLRATGSPAPGWTSYAYSGPFPAGTITSATFGVHVISDPPNPIRVAFDNITATGRTWTFAGDNSSDPPNPI